MKVENTNKCLIRNILIIYLILFCVLRILLAIKYGYAYMWGDEIAYWQISQSLFEQGKTIMRNMPVNFFSCLYPWSISWVHMFENYDVQYMVTYAMNAVMMSSFLIPFYMLCRRMLRHDGQVLVLTVLVSMLPEFSYNARIITENLFFPVSMWTFYYAYTVFEDEQVDFRKAVLLGFLSFLCFGTRTAGICVFLAICTYFMWSIIFESGRKKSALSMLCIVATFFTLYTVFTRLYKAANPGMSSGYLLNAALTRINISYFWYWFQGGLRYLLVFAVITGIFPLVLPVTVFRKLERQDRRLFVFALSVLAWAIVESVGMFYIKEGMIRIHMRYVSYLIPVVLLLFSKSCMLLKQHGEKLTKGQAVFLCIYCLLGLCVAVFCGLFIERDSMIDAVSASHLTISHSVLLKLINASNVKYYKLIIIISIALFAIVNLILLLRGWYRIVLLVTFVCLAFVQMGNSVLSYAKASALKQFYAATDVEFKQIDEYLLDFVEENAKVAYMRENFLGSAMEIHISGRNLSVIPLDLCTPLIDKETATLKDNLIPYVGFHELQNRELGEIPDYIIMEKSLFEERGIASYTQVYATDNFLVLRKESELFKFDIPTFSYTVEGTTGDNWITEEDAIFCLTSDTALDKIIISVDYLSGTQLGIADDMGNAEIFDLKECGGVVEYIVEGENQKDIELRLYGVETQKPMIVYSDSNDERDLCANIKDVSIVCK